MVGLLIFVYLYFLGEDSQGQAPGNLGLGFNTFTDTVKLKVCKKKKGKKKERYSRVMKATVDSCLEIVIAVNE